MKGQSVDKRDLSPDSPDPKDPSLDPERLPV